MIGEKRLTVGLFAIVIFVITFSAISYAVRDARGELELPEEGDCRTERDCPVRMFCYRDLPLSYITNNSADTETLDSACACYHLFGEEGFANVPGTDASLYPDGGYCKEEASYKTLLIVITSIITLIVAFTMTQFYRTIFQMVRIKSFTLNASGLVLFFATLASTFEFLLCLCYLTEISRVVDEPYLIHDAVRPIMFGAFSSFQIAALLNISLMWADVYQKSASMGKKTNLVARLRQVICVLIFLTMFFTFAGLTTGLTVITSVWTLLILVACTLFYYRFGKKLGNLLTPADLNAPGAVKSNLAASQIIKTSRWICAVNVVFVCSLLGFSAYLSRPDSGPVAFLCILSFLICTNLQQVRMLEYIRFGARRKLVAGGYGTFRAGIMMKATSLSPSEDKAMTKNTSHTNSKTKTSVYEKSNVESVAEEGVVVMSEVPSYTILNSSAKIAPM